jgi:hypothetical protein
MSAVTVTAEDIVRASGHVGTCPVSRALARATGAAAVVVLDDVARWLSQGELIERRLPDAAQRFIAAYDAGWRVEPFTFELDLGVAA